MYGVLVVELPNQQLGYLAAFSGQVEDQQYDINFVPPLYDRLSENGFFKKGEQELSEMNTVINDLENSHILLELENELKSVKRKAQIEIDQIKLKNKKNKLLRSQLRSEEHDPNKLKNESINDHYELKKCKTLWHLKINGIEKRLSEHHTEIFQLKSRRKHQSAELQNQLFEKYTFINYKKESKNLLELFTHLGLPPAGAGDCAAPKLLQYAYKNDLKPISMGEFWWGKPLKSEIRTEGNFYPSCSSKCLPILTHMLSGLDLEEDPALIADTSYLKLEMVYDDEHIAIINKPSGLLSVPNKTNNDSVLTRIQKKYPTATGPLLAHRLDQGTSGLIIITKSEITYKDIQKQFLNRAIIKKYSAILDGIIQNVHGIIELPLIVDEEDRPRQKVCHQTGKKSITEWRTIKRLENKTQVQFIPKTGRTHQLRVHSAHIDGLNSPIVGDKLYGKKAERLFLHADYLEFKHPITGKMLKFQIDSNF